MKIIDDNITTDKDESIEHVLNNNSDEFENMEKNYFDSINELESPSFLDHQSILNFRV